MKKFTLFLSALFISMMGFATEGVSVEKLTGDEEVNHFYLPQGVAVNKNVASPYFGYTYVAAATDGADDGGSDRADTQKRGIFVYDKELNCLNADNVGYLPANAVESMTDVSRQAIHRVVVNPVNNHVVFCYNVENASAVWSMDPANLTGDAVNLIEGLAITKANAICFDAEGTLYVMDNANTTDGGKLVKVVNGELVTVAQDAIWGVQDLSLASDGRGGIWVAQNRWQVDAYAVLSHVNAAGVVDFKVNGDASDELKALFSNANGNASYRGQCAYNVEKDILAFGGNKVVTLFQVAYDEEGVPSITKIVETPIIGGNIDGVDFYANGDFAVVSASVERFMKFAYKEPVKMVGVVKRAIQNGDAVIVLTHEADGTAHIYNVVDGVLAEVSQEGVIARDPENAGDLLAISDIALTEDGKLVANNYMITQSGDDQVVAGDKRGETRVYIWNDLAGAPSVLFTSKMSSNWFQSKQGLTMAVKGTSDNMEILMTGIHKSKAWARVSSYRVIDGAYTEPDVNHNDHYYFYDINDAIALETTVGTQYELNASPLGEMNWILDANLINPVEIVEPETNNVEITTSVALSEDLGKKFNGASYVTVGEQVLMVAPYATPEGKLIGVEILDITNGLETALYVDMLYLEDAVEAAGAATAVKVVEGETASSLVITLVADATIHTLEAEISNEVVYEVYEDEITNLVIDLDNLLLIGGPSSAFQVEVVLGLGEYDMTEDKFQLLPESSVIVLGTEATFVEGYATVDGIAQTATAVVKVQWNGMNLELHLSMSAAPMEATVVVVENATVEIEKYIIFGDMYDYALKMTGEWINPEDGLTYPVLVEVPVYYPEATEPSEIMSTVTVGGWEDDDPWLGFGEGTLTVTTVDNVVTATGIVQNPMAGVAIDITISGTITTSGVENATVVVKSVKMIKNGQLIISKDGKEFNAQGTILK